MAKKKIAKKPTRGSKSAPPAGTRPRSSGRTPSRTGKIGGAPKQKVVLEIKTIEMLIPKSIAPRNLTLSAAHPDGPVRVRGHKSPHGGNDFGDSVAFEKKPISIGSDTAFFIEKLAVEDIVDLGTRASGKLTITIKTS